MAPLLKINKLSNLNFLFPVESVSYIVMLKFDNVVIHDEVTEEPIMF
jgi:hypothetical protein